MEMDHFALREQLNSGDPIPPVGASDIKQMRDATQRLSAEMPPRQNSAIGLGAWAAYGVEAASSRPQQFGAIMLRAALLSALVGRGVLNDYRHGEELDERVYQAAATMPCNKDDLAEAMMQLQLAQSPADLAAKAKAELLEKGYDADKPEVDGKFLGWLRDNC